jgi:hypothetical protein
MIIVSAGMASALLAFRIYICYGFSDRLELKIGSNGMSVMAG